MDGWMDGSIVSKNERRECKYYIRETKQKQIRNYTQTTSRATTKIVTKFMHTRFLKTGWYTVYESTQTLTETDTSWFFTCIFGIRLDKF